MGKSSISGGFSIATFDDRRIRPHFGVAAFIDVPRITGLDQGKQVPTPNRGPCRCIRIARARDGSGAAMPMRLLPGSQVAME